MKTIEVSDEMYAKLIDLATEMTTQDPRGTRMPHMFQIREKKKVYDWSLNGEFKIWVDMGDQVEIETIGELKEYLENNGIEYDEEKLTTEWEEKDKYMYESDLDLFIEENCPELKECSYSWEYVYHNHFLTEKGCKEHIQRNHYHYNEPVDYLNHAWRNPEMDLISEFLCGLVGKKIHT
jgi:hypothetical protein